MTLCRTEDGRGGWRGLSIIFLGGITGASRKTSQHLVLLRVSGRSVPGLATASLPDSSWLRAYIEQHPLTGQVVPR